MRNQDRARRAALRVAPPWFQRTMAGGAARLHPPPQEQCRGQKRPPYRERSSNDHPVHDLHPGAGAAPGLCPYPEPGAPPRRQGRAPGRYVHELEAGQGAVRRHARRARRGHLLRLLAHLQEGHRADDREADRRDQRAPRRNLHGTGGGEGRRRPPSAWLPERGSGAAQTVDGRARGRRRTQARQSGARCAGGDARSVEHALAGCSTPDSLRRGRPERRRSQLLEPPPIDRQHLV